ncbi:MAG: alkA 1 [Gemmataceae bacterium]|nr:alkA 1 [Gemmataceae bacterium]
MHAKAVRHLARKCPVMKKLVARVGPCTLAPVSDDPFTLLVRCVIYQQISTKAATSIFNRLTAVVGGMPFARARLVALTEPDFKACGVSGPKQRTLRAVAAHIDANPDLLPGIEDREDDLLRTQLTAIKGIGPWSADMFLMFGLGRPDVLPVGDLGLRMGVRAEYGLEDLPTADEIIKLAEKWQPYRSVATWYFWRGLEAAAKEAKEAKKG